MDRNYYPNRQFQRDKWVDLNGEWSFKYYVDGNDNRCKIVVPFCPESQYSQVAFRGVINECVYERTFAAPQFRADDERVTLHFGAVDQEAKVYVNEKYVGRHFGGYTPFSFDITEQMVSGENTLKVIVYDDVTDNVPSGKQSEKLNSFGCFYTRTTGVWQTVWLEVVPKDRILSVKYYTNIVDQSVEVALRTSDAGDVKITVLYDGKTVGEYNDKIECDGRFRIKLSERHLWDVGAGNLYDVIIRYKNDEVKSYFGLRSVGYDGLKFMLNGRSVFQRFVLDQGYYFGGVYTPKDSEEFVADIERVLRLGFNGIRLHQKVFDPEFLYYCDKMGVMVWGEFPNWGVRFSDLEALGEFTKEWTETIERDFNHPSIVTWCPLNEVWDNIYDKRIPRDVRFVDAVYQLTKAIDPTRPCVDVSGGHHGHKTDLFDFHSYSEFDELKSIIEKLEKDNELNVWMLYNDKEPWLKYDGKTPVNISEFGGKKFVKDSRDKTDDIKTTCGEFVVTSTDDWGYGNVIAGEEEFVEQYEKVVKLLLSCKKLSGFCYTQLYDVEQEQNGFYTYDRKSKFSEKALDRIRNSNLSTACIEKE